MIWVQRVETLHRVRLLELKEIGSEGAGGLRDLADLLGFLRALVQLITLVLLSHLDKEPRHMTRWTDTVQRRLNQLQRVVSCRLPYNVELIVSSLRYTLQQSVARVSTNQHILFNFPNKNVDFPSQRTHL